MYIKLAKFDDIFKKPRSTPGVTKAKKLNHNINTGNAGHCSK